MSTADISSTFDPAAKKKKKKKKKKKLTNKIRNTVNTHYLNRRRKLKQKTQNVITPSKV